MNQNSGGAEKGAMLRDKAWFINHLAACAKSFLDPQGY